MTKRPRIAVLLALATTLQLGQSVVTEPANAVSVTLPKASELQTSNDNSIQVAFDKLVDEYFVAAFLSQPNWGTEIGFHEYDDKMATFDSRAIANRVAQLKNFRQQFEALEPARLSKASQLDRLMIIADSQAQVLELETIKNWQRNPDQYSSAISSNIFSLMKRNFAPPEERLRSVIAREKLVPIVLQNARKNLTGTPKIYTSIALEQLPGIIDFFEKQVPEAFIAVKDQSLQTEFKLVNRQTIEELKRYQAFLKSDVLPRSIDKFAIGKENYQNKLLYEEMVSEPIETLLANGYTELHRLQKDFISTAKAIDPTKDPRRVFEDISSQHPKPDQLLVSVSNILDTLKEQSRAVVTIPSEDELKVQETPPFMRATTFASMDAPGAFEKVAKEAYYQVTLPEKNWDAKKVEEHMRSFCDLDLINTSVHEAYPGHYVQGLWVKKAPSKTRKILGCGSNSEGWAHYCEELMADRQPENKKLKLVQIHDALLRVCRYIVGIRMHTDGMTVEQSKEFFVKEGFQENANADRESKRGTEDPTYLVYTLGKLQILALRDDYKKAKGDKFNLKEFHDAFLAEGVPPIKLVRQALLPEHQ